MSIPAVTSILSRAPASRAGVWYRGDHRCGSGAGTRYHCQSGLSAARWKTGSRQVEPHV